MTSFLDIFRRRASESKQAPPRIPPAVVIDLPAHDDSEETSGVEPTIGGGDVLGLAAVIGYVDSRGVESTRRITIRYLKPQSGDALIYAHCHERKALRCFKASRVRSLIDLESGEAIDDRARILAEFTALAATAAGAPSSPTDAVMRRNRSGIHILLFLARCDGEQHPAETQVILEYLDGYCGPPGLDVGEAEAALRRLHPDVHTYDDALANLAETDPPHLAFVARCASRLIAADGVISKEEFDFASDLAAALDESDT